MPVFNLLWGAEEDEHRSIQSGLYLCFSALAAFGANRSFRIRVYAGHFAFTVFVIILVHCALSHSPARSLPGWLTGLRRLKVFGNHLRQLLLHRRVGLRR